MRPHVLAIACAAMMCGLTPLAQTSNSLDCEKASESGLPLPTTIPPERLADYEKQLLAFLQAGTYVKLGWCGDKGIRDTGPWIKDTYYGTHKAARVYYSPAVVKWLSGNRIGAIPDGAMIIKEGYTILRSTAATFMRRGRRGMRRRIPITRTAKAPIP